jgi:uncharacterized protein DUF6881
VILHGARAAPTSRGRCVIASASPGVTYVRYVVTHFQIRWDHDDPDDPLTIYEELSDERYELRKVEEFADGRRGNSYIHP